MLSLIVLILSPILCQSTWVKLFSSDSDSTVCENGWDGWSSLDPQYNYGKTLDYDGLIINKIKFVFSNAEWAVVDMPESMPFSAFIGQYVPIDHSNDGNTNGVASFSYAQATSAFGSQMRIGVSDGSSSPSSEQTDWSLFFFEDGTNSDHKGKKAMNIGGEEKCSNWDQATSFEIYGNSEFDFTCDIDEFKERLMVFKPRICWEAAQSYVKGQLQDLERCACCDEYTTEEKEAFDCTLHHTGDYPVSFNFKNICTTGNACGRRRLLDLAKGFN